MSKIYKRKPNVCSYYEIGQEFFGFPSNGLWLVIDGSQNRLVKLKDIDKGKDISNLKGFEWTYDVIFDVIKVILSRPYTQAELANAIAGALYFREEKDKS